MRRRIWTGIAVVGLAVLAGTPGFGAGGPEDDEGRWCSEATLRGRYGIQIQGTRPAAPPAPAGSIASVIGVIVRHYDGQGQFTQVNNEKGSIGGLGPVDREGLGTYSVNEDCTGSHQLQIPGVPFPVITGVHVMLPLYETYRPTSRTELVGQEKACRQIEVLKRRGLVGCALGNCPVRSRQDDAGSSDR